MQLVFGRGQVSLHNVCPGDLAWRNKDPALEARLRASYESLPAAQQRRLPVAVAVTAAAGEPLKVVLTDPQGRRGEGTTPAPAVAAEGRGIGPAEVQKAVGVHLGGEAPLAAAAWDFSGGALWRGMLLCRVGVPGSVPVLAIWGCGLVDGLMRMWRTVVPCTGVLHLAPLPRVAGKGGQLHRIHTPPPPRGSCVHAGCDFAAGLFVPASAIKEARRQAVAALLAARREGRPQAAAGTAAAAAPGQEEGGALPALLEAVQQRADVWRSQQQRSGSETGADQEGE